MLSGLFSGVADATDFVMGAPPLAKAVEFAAQTSTKPPLGSADPRPRSQKAPTPYGVGAF